MTADVAALADAVLAARESARPMPLPSARQPGLTLHDAYAVAEALRRHRIARGERVVGWKIGFTNRTIWDRYGVHAPIWGPVWDTTLTLLDGTAATLPLAGLVQPRLEPEIVFGFARSPEPGMDEAALVGCLEWVAHGVEVVHTHCEGWRFTAADTVADGALHGRLLVGPRVPAAAWPRLAADLAATTMTLACDGRVVDRGVGANVLGGPLAALALWLAAMVRDTPDWRVEPGHVVTTGTLTDAWPLAPGQRWTTQPGDARLPGLDLAIAP
ncbi:2-keto-4-pentenoate hydratase [Azohydromonas sediminis]|uniref:2-keto-4-pentenoate hydratase n=1 Tax=Azohydromonas sediminis TaxID=2259674 RepID=UPI000E65DF26|nr:hydratase [Azohydromonas sediminis]